MNACRCTVAHAFLDSVENGASYPPKRQRKKKPAGPLTGPRISLPGCATRKPRPEPQDHSGGEGVLCACAPAAEAIAAVSRGKLVSPRLVAPAPTATVLPMRRARR
jgi:hypothetical protein